MFTGRTAVLLLLLWLTAVWVVAADNTLSIITLPSGDKVIAANANYGAAMPSGTTISGTVGFTHPDNACSDLTSPTADQEFVFIASQRGNCSFVEKIARIQAAGAKVAIIVNYEDDVFFMQANSTEMQGITVVAVMVSSSDGALIKALSADSAISIHPYVRSSFDGSIVFLLIISVATVVAGAYWSSAPERAESFSLPAYRDPDIPVEEVQYMTPGAAIGFIFCASFGLVILFFFINALIYLLFLVFGFGGASALVLALSPLVRKYFPRLRENVDVRFCGAVEKTTIALMIPCYGLALWWFIARKTSYSWVLQDILGIALLLSIQRTLRLPNIKVSAILLSMAFVYDIFWVFISPYFFQSSVMVTVATGGDTGEAIPMLIRFPRLADELGGYSLLGLGDIALPGLFVSYMLRFDYKHKLRGCSGYFPIVAIGYTVGIIFTDIALLVMNSGQPALLYLVPCTLGVTCLVASYRGDLAELWEGNPPQANHHRRLEEEEDYLTTNSSPRP